MKYIICLPYVYKPYFDECITTCKFPRENMLIIDNTVNNIGIMASHNRGIDKVKETNADWLIILSAAIRFGPTGGLDFIKVLEDYPDHYIIHAASNNVKGGVQQKLEGKDEVNEVKGWHLTAFKREVFENIGRWDQNFTPYGFDDIDLSIRIQKFYKGKAGWDTYPCDVHDTVMAHSINLGGVISPSEPRIEYFKNKWGRYHGEWQKEAWDHPFNNPNNSLAYWPDAPDGGKWND